LLQQTGLNQSIGQNQILLDLFLIYFCRGQIKFQLCAEILLCIENVYEVVEFVRAHLYKEVFLQTELITNVWERELGGSLMCVRVVEGVCANRATKSYAHENGCIFIAFATIEHWHFS
jgi:hypothetical protein